MSNENTNWINKKELIDKPISITDTNPQERVSVWDNNNKKFINEGETISFNNGTSARVGKGMRFPESEAKDYNFSVQYNYAIEYNDTKCLVSMPKTIHDQFQQINDILKTVDKNLLDIELVISKEDNPKANFTKYLVKTYKIGSGPKHPADGFNPKVPEETIVDDTGGVDLLSDNNALLKPTDNEQAIMSKLSTIGSVSKEDFIATLKANLSIDDARAGQLWEMFNNAK